MVVEFPSGTYDVRIILFCLGSVATIIGVHARQASIAPPLAAAVTVAAVLANGWYIVRVLLPYGPWHPFVGDHGMAWFATGIALWTADAAFGAVCLRLGAVTRWGGVLLGVGSPMALTGMSQFGLTAPESPTLFIPISLVGIALNGLGWILLGLDLMTDRRAMTRPRPDAIRQEPIG